MPHKVRLLIPSLAGGGAERVCVCLANHYAEEGMLVELAVLEKTGTFFSNLDARVSIVSLDCRRARHAIGKLIRVFREDSRVPNLVFGFELGVAASMARLLCPTGAPVVYREGNSPYGNVSQIRRWAYGALLTWCSGVIVQSNAAARELRELGLSGLPQLVIGNPARIDDRQRHARAVRSGPVLVAIGRMTPQKGYDRLLHGFVHLLAARPDARLIMLGEGEQQVELMNLARRMGVQHAVEWHGFQRDVVRYLDEADLFVLPSRFEGQPNALVEAILRQRPVLAAGGDTVCEMLSRLGLADSYLSDEDFGAVFVQRVANTLAQPAAHWTRASGRLQQLCNPELVARGYGQFLMALTTSGQII